MEFKNAVVRKRANIYHGGHVTSRSIVTADGEMKTLGIMLPGVYRFNTEAPEVVDLIQGRCRTSPNGANTPPARVSASPVTPISKSK